MIGSRSSRALLLVAAGLCLVQSSAASCLDCWPGLVPLTLSKLGYPQFLPNIGSGPSASSDPRTRQWVSSADSLMKKRGLADVDKAAELYRKALAVFPNDIDLQVMTATTLPTFPPCTSLPCTPHPTFQPYISFCISLHTLHPTFPFHSACIVVHH